MKEFYKTPKLAALRCRSPLAVFTIDQIVSDLDIYVASQKLQFRISRPTKIRTQT